MTCCLSVPETFLPGFALKVHVLGTLLVPGKPSKEPRDAPFPKLLPKCLPFPKVPCPHLQVPFSFLEADFSPISRPYYVLFPFGGPRLPTGGQRLVGKSGFIPGPHLHPHEATQSVCCWPWVCIWWKGCFCFSLYFYLWLNTQHIKLTI